MAGILPQLDNGPLYSQVQFGQTLGYNPGGGISNLAVLESVVPTFLCPSDTQTGHINTQLIGGTPLDYATTNYKACGGEQLVSRRR